MFETLQMAPPDAILGLTEAFKKDPHPQKINLSVGVYQDASGKTPIMNVVREAEKRMVAEETTKSYLAIDGLPEYGRFVRELLLGPGHEIVTSQRAVTAQTPGGTGACAWRRTSCNRRWELNASGAASRPGPITPTSFKRRGCRSKPTPISTRPARGLTSTP